jgi:hypothetical protein
MKELASLVLSFDNGLLILITVSGVCGVLRRFATNFSSTWMNLKRRCPPPVQSSSSLLHLEQDGCAVSHYEPISL